MIRNFKSRTAQDIFDGLTSRQARKIAMSLHSKIQRLFDQLNAITQVETLKIPPSNRLEKLKGNLKGYWGLRINKQWRITFKWKESDAHNVDCH